MWPTPEKVVLEGRYCRLEPVQESHRDRLFELVNGPGSEDRYRYIPNLPPKSREEHDEWFKNDAEFVTFAIIDKATNKIEGRQSLMRIAPEHGCMEVGYVVWGTGMARTRIATEALFLCASYAFDVLKYRRFEWKCDNANVPSKNAALRFGFEFEGLFRQHMMVKGVNRDTAWFAMMDINWPKLKESFEQWLDPSNFGEDGQQIRKLSDFRS